MRLLIIYILFFFVSHTATSQVRMKFINNTGKTLDELTVNDVLLSHLEPQELKS